MDAVKVIKKSGAPGAVPAVTAYVDEPLLPKVSAEDAGKVIGVDENGELEAVTISVPSIPTPEPSDSGKVLGVNNSGAYELQNPSGGDYDFDIFYSYQNDSYNTTISNYTVTKALTRVQFIAKVTNKEAIRAKLIRDYYNDSGDTPVTKQYPAILSWYSYEDSGTGYKLHFNEIKATSLLQLTLTFNNDGVLTAAATS